MIKATSLRSLTNSISGWRFDPEVSKKNDCRVYRLNHAGQTALAARDTHPESGDGWRVQIIGQRAYHYSDRDYPLATMTAAVGAKMEALAPTTE